MYKVLIDGQTTVHYHFANQLCTQFILFWHQLTIPLQLTLLILNTE